MYSKDKNIGTGCSVLHDKLQANTMIFIIITFL